MAPGFMNLPGVATGLQAIANRIKARVLRDAPLGTIVGQAIEARGPTGGFDWQTNSRRDVLLMPHMMALDEDASSPTAGKLIAEPYSVRFAGVWLSSIMEHGYHHSPSNRPVLVDEASQDILYIPGDPSGETQTLRGAGIVTCEQGWGRGVHTSGNRSAAFPTDTDPRNALHAHAQQGTEEGMGFGMDLIGLTLRLTRWYEMDPPGPHDTYQAKEFFSGDAYGSEDVPADAMIVAAGQMLDATKRWSQDMAVEFGVQTDVSQFDGCLVRCGGRAIAGMAGAAPVPEPTLVTAIVPRTAGRATARLENVT